MSSNDLRIGIVVQMDTVESVLIKCKPGMMKFIISVSNTEFLGRKFHYCEWINDCLFIEKSILEDLQQIIEDPIEEVDIRNCELLNFVTVMEAD